MKQPTITICAICICLFSCRGHNSGPREASTTNRQPHDSSLIRREPTSISIIRHADTKDGVIGIWAAVGDENATFVISRDSITYPDHGSAYQYQFINDTMNIEYDGYTGHYLVKANGPDTLVFSGDDDRQVYYRFAN